MITAAWLLVTTLNFTTCKTVEALTAGKPMKVARCAAARKLLHIAGAVVKKG